MNYTINQLLVFCKVVETGSITKAAEELFMSQPAVSIQLKNFQDQFPLALTELIGRSIQVTEFGFEIAHIAERALNELDNLKHKTIEYQGLISGKLKIISASTGKHIVPNFLTSFLKKYPDLELALDVGNSGMIAENLKNGKSDFAVNSNPIHDPDFEEELLLVNKLYMVGTADNYDQIKPLIFREEGSATRLLMEKYFKEIHPEKRKKFELKSNEAVKQAVIAGLGHSIISLISMKNELSEGSIKIIERDDLPIINHWRLIWIKEKKFSPAAKAYLDYIKINKENIINNSFSWYLKYT
jgi:LysR family transcriptional regulator, low CO2-responsive transcriptional regulator